MALLEIKRAKSGKKSTKARQTTSKKWLWRDYWRRTWHLVLEHTKLKHLKIILFDSDFWGEFLAFVKNKMLKNALIDSLENISLCNSAKSVIKELLTQSK